MGGEVLEREVIMASVAVSGWGLTVLRVVIGIVFLAHGIDKFFFTGIGNIAGFFGQLGIPLAGLSAFLVAATELVGGVALIAGFFTRIFAVLLAVIVFVAMLLVHVSNGFFASSGGVELTLVLTAACVALALSGAGEAAVQRDSVPTRDRASAS